jgi:hypothetical protein
LYLRKYFRKYDTSVRTFEGRARALLGLQFTSTEGLPYTYSTEGTTLYGGTSGKWIILPEARPASTRGPYGNTSEILK